MSEIASESAQELEAQRHYLVQEAKAEMIWRDTRNAEVASHVTSELGHYHLHAEGQSDEFQQRVEKSMFCTQKFFVHKPEKRNYPPESRRCRVRIRSEKGQLQNLHQENARINDLLKQIQITFQEGFRECGPAARSVFHTRVPSNASVIV